MLRPSNKLSFQVSGSANCTDSGPQTICCPAVASRNYVIAAATLHWHDPSVYTDLSLSETVTALIQHTFPTISFLFLYMEIRKQDAFQNSKLISPVLAQGLRQRLQPWTFLSDLWQEVVHHRPLLWAGGRPNGCEKHSVRESPRKVKGHSQILGQVTVARDSARQYGDEGKKFCVGSNNSGYINLHVPPLHIYTGCEPPLQIYSRSLPPLNACKPMFFTGARIWILFGI